MLFAQLTHHVQVTTLLYLVKICKWKTQSIPQTPRSKKLSLQTLQPASLKQVKYITRNTSRTFKCMGRLWCQQWWRSTRGSRETQQLVVRLLSCTDLTETPSSLIKLLWYQSKREEALLGPQVLPSRAHPGAGRERNLWCRMNTKWSSIPWKTLMGSLLRILNILKLMGLLPLSLRKNRGTNTTIYSKVTKHNQPKGIMSHQSQMELRTVLSFIWTNPALRSR